MRERACLIGSRPAAQEEAALNFVSDRDMRNLSIRLEKPAYAPPLVAVSTHWRQTASSARVRNGLPAQRVLVFV